ncbi:hypothetical protein F0L68_39810 [Solihabitans fulvus]|uniref:Uncharacterized protein n=1 Tax=Solihabitans fulvus TaxID=1892852 RepID=A0A5B2WAS2_9PSEU|nr:hypothetical protein [Solihabitans fulvus]KAA2248425.1 hypothetical protein F0L68_39810 [Solihabitans fulvus]
MSEEPAPAPAGAEAGAAPLPPDQDRARVDQVPSAEWRRHNQVINNFYGDPHAGRARFGIAVHASARTVTGPIGAAEVAGVLAGYVPPDGFDAAVAGLRERHLLVLAGPEGVGRRAGAIALLGRVLTHGEPLVDLAPSAALRELAAEGGLRPGTGYLVRDRVETGEPTARQRFDVERLVQQLIRIGSFLVVTADADAATRPHLRELSVPWRAPNPSWLFDMLVADVDRPAADDPAYRRLRDRVAALTLPREVIEVAARLPDGVDAALGALDDPAPGEVADWFDDRRSLRDVLSVAALAFAHGLPEPAFEAHRQRLLALAGEALAATDRGPADKTEPPQHAVDRRQKTSLPALSSHLPAEPGESGGEHRLVFRSESHRERVIAELHDRHSVEVWGPLCAWAHEIAAQRPVSEAHVQLALGVSLLCRVAPAEVRESLLAPWSDGEPTQWLTASYVLSWMCFTDALAPVALRLALAMAGDQSPGRRATAAMSFAGVLGIRYPAEALTRLWHLALRDGQVSRLARESLDSLFCGTAAETVDSVVVLDFLGRALRETARVDSTARRVDNAMAAVVAVLAAVRPDTGEPMAAFVLRSDRASAPTLGCLWAEALRGARRRGGAVDALRATLAALGGGEQGRELARSLGSQLRAHLSGRKARQLRGLLGRELRRPAAGQRLPDALTAALLDAFDAPAHPVAHGARVR